MLKYHSFELSPFSENTYLVYNELTLECVFVDPGCHSKAEQDLLTETVKKFDFVPIAVLNTHCHLDHIFGNKFLCDYYSVPLFIPAKDQFLLNMAAKQGDMFGIKVDNSPQPAGYLPEDGEWSLNSITLKTIFTPGHTPGEICLYSENDQFLIAGDVLFRGSIGRTDLWGGDMDTLLSSISKKLFVLPDETVVLSGHGEPTTIGQEKQSNPFFQ